MPPLAAPFAAAAGTAADAASAAEAPPVAATAVTAVAPSTAVAAAAVSAAAERVGGAWEGGRAPWEGHGRGGLRGQFWSISDFYLFFGLFLRRLCVFNGCVCITVHMSRLWGSRSVVSIFYEFTGQLATECANRQGQPTRSWDEFFESLAPA